jgi:hypothetical protein
MPAAGSYYAKDTTIMGAHKNDIVALGKSTETCWALEIASWEQLTVGIPLQIAGLLVSTLCFLSL